MQTQGVPGVVVEELEVAVVGELVAAVVETEGVAVTTGAEVEVEVEPVPGSSSSSESR